MTDLPSTLLLGRISPFEETNFLWLKKVTCTFTIYYNWNIGLAKATLLFGLFWCIILKAQAGNSTRQGTPVQEGLPMQLEGCCCPHLYIFNQKFMINIVRIIFLIIWRPISIKDYLDDFFESSAKYLNSPIFILISTRITSNLIAIF